MAGWATIFTPKHNAIGTGTILRRRIFRAFPMQFFVTNPVDCAPARCDAGLGHWSEVGRRGADLWPQIEIALRLQLGDANDAALVGGHETRQQIAERDLLRLHGVAAGG